MSIRSALVCAATSIVVLGCTSLAFEKTWRSPDARQVDMRGRKVLVIATNLPRVVRLGVEAAVADQLRLSKVHAVASYEVLDPDSGADVAKMKMRLDHYDSAFVIRVTDKPEDVYATPGVYQPETSLGTYWRWGGGWGGTYAPALASDAKIYVETLVYSVKDDHLAWSAVTSANNPADVGSFCREITEEAVHEMRRQGLLI